MQLHGCKGFNLRTRFHPRLFVISIELAEDESPGSQRLRALKHFHTLVTQRLDGRTRRRLHGDIAQDLHQVVLHHVAHRADAIVKSPAALDAELLRHGDLHAFDVLPIPDRFQEKIGEAEEDHVLNRVLAKVVVDAEDMSSSSKTL